MLFSNHTGLGKCAIGLQCSEHMAPNNCTDDGNLLSDNVSN